MSSIETPKARRPPSMASVSSAVRGSCNRVTPRARAAVTSARFVNDFDPGGRTTAATGRLSGRIGIWRVEVTPRRLRVRRFGPGRLVKPRHFL